MPYYPPLRILEAGADETPGPPPERFRGLLSVLSWMDARIHHLSHHPEDGHMDPKNMLWNKESGVKRGRCAPVRRPLISA